MMNCLERVYTAMSGGVPDRVPVIPKMWVDLAAEITGNNLLDVVADPLTALRVVVDAGLELGFDAVRQFHLPQKQVRVENGRVLEVDGDGKRVGVVDMQGGLVTHLDCPEYFMLEDPYRIAHHHYWTCERPLVNSIADAKRICVPGKAYYKQLGWEERQKKTMELAKDRIAVIGDCDSPTLAFYVSFRGMQQAMFDLLDAPELVHAVMDKGLEIAIERGKFNIDLGIRILRVNDSAANMSVISPALWKEFIKPRFKVLCDELHAYCPGVRIYCHICGNTLPVMEDLVETGLDCIAPLDPLGGFTCAQAREKVGRRVALMGGMDTLSFISSNPEQIVEAARKCMEEAGKEGGYILGSGCVVPRAAKRENLAAVVQAAHIYGKYREM